MSVDPLLAILGMAVVTFAIRAGGLGLAAYLPSTGFVALWLKHLPGAVLAALVVPAVANGGPAEWTAAGATLLMQLSTRSIFASIVAGVVTVVLMRHLLGA